MSAENQSRDDTYFLESIVFKVEGTIFQVPRYQFANNEVFSTMFTLPPGEDTIVEGSSEAKPFELLGVLKKDFRAFLRALYPLSPNTYLVMTTEEWTAALALSDMWGFDIFKRLAIERLEALDQMDPVNKILLGEKYSLPTWFVAGCTDLINREEGPQAIELGTLGQQRAIDIYKLREMRLVSRRHFDAEARIKEVFGVVAGDRDTTDVTVERIEWVVPLGI